MGPAFRQAIGKGSAVCQGVTGVIDFEAGLFVDFSVHPLAPMPFVLSLWEGLYQPEPAY